MKDKTTAKVLPKSVFINQEQKLEDPRQSDTILVLAVNDVDLRSLSVILQPC